MTGTLQDELFEIGQWVDSMRGGRSRTALRYARRSVPGELPDQVRLAWQSVWFSNAGEACLKRYFTFHLSKLSELLHSISDMHPAQPDLLQGLQDLLVHLVTVYGPYIDEQVIVPHSYYRIGLPFLNTLKEQFLTLIQAARISAELKDCLFSYAAQYEPDSVRCQFSFASIRYFELITRQIPDLDLTGNAAEEHLNEFLMQMDFNHLLYLAYHQNRITKTLLISGPAESLEILRTERQLAGRRPEQHRYRYHADWPSIKTMLTGFLDEEISLHTQRLSSVPGGQQATPAKITLELSVAQIACLIRLCCEEGIFATTNLSEIFRTFTLMFRSKKQHHISPGSLSKEYYAISQVTAAVMRDKLSKMVSRINRNFFPV